MPTQDEINAYIGRLKAKRDEASAAYAAYWNGTNRHPLEDGTFMSMLGAGAQKLRDDCAAVTLNFKPKNYAAWYLIIGTLPPVEREDLKFDFPAPHSLEAMLDRVIAGTEPGSRPGLPLHPKPTLAEIEAYYSKLMAKREEGAEKYAQRCGLERIPATTKMISDLRQKAAIKLRDAFKKIKPNFDAKKYASWHVLVGSTPIPERIESLDFPGTFSLEALLDRILDGSEPGTAPPKYMSGHGRPRRKRTPKLNGSEPK